MGKFQKTLLGMVGLSTLIPMYYAYDYSNKAVNTQNEQQAKIYQEKLDKHLIYLMLGVSIFAIGAIREDMRQTKLKNRVHGFKKRQFERGL